MRSSSVAGAVNVAPAPLFTILLAAAGLLGGSVLNVVVHRGPSVWGLAPPPPHPEGPFSLWTPRSHCPACLRTLGAADLVPLLSYALAGGRCRACGAAIGVRYPLVEAAGLGCGLLAAWIAPGAAAFPALLFLLLILAAALVDGRTGYLPDALTGPATWTALLASAAGLSEPPAASILGASIGYLAFRGLAAGYEALRGREGLGRGDAKLLAAGGAWLGPFALPFVVLAAAAAGLAFALLSGRRQMSAELRFGPFLAVGIVGAAVLAAALPGRVVPPWPWG